MKKLFMIAVILFVYSSVFAIDVLWQRASALADNSKNLVAGKMTVEMISTEQMTDANMNIIANSLDIDTPI